MKLKKILFIILGTLSLTLGIIGAFLPLLPTTPFVLLSAYLYARSSPKLYNFLLTNRLFGRYLDNYKRGRGIPLKTKIIAIAMLWISILYVCFFVIDSYVLKGILNYIALWVTVHIAGNPTGK